MGFSDFADIYGMLEKSSLIPLTAVSRPFPDSSGSVLIIGTVDIIDFFEKVRHAKDWVNLILFDVLSKNIYF